MAGKNGAECAVFYGLGLAGQRTLARLYALLALVLVSGCAAYPPLNPELVVEARAALAPQRIAVPEALAQKLRTTEAGLYWLDRHELILRLAVNEASGFRQPRWGVQADLYRVDPATARIEAVEPGNHARLEERIEARLASYRVVGYQSGAGPQALDVIPGAAALLGGDGEWFLETDGYAGNIRLQVDGQDLSGSFLVKLDPRNPWIKGRLRNHRGETRFSVGGDWVQDLPRLERNSQGQALFRAARMPVFFRKTRMAPNGRYVLLLSNYLIPVDTSREWGGVERLVDYGYGGVLDMSLAPSWERLALLRQSGDRYHIELFRLDPQRFY